MAIVDFIKGVFGANDRVNINTCSVDAIKHMHYKTLAMEASINLIAKTISRAEFQTFKKGKISKKTNYYLLNVEANKNKSASLFWKEAIGKLLRNGEVMILIQNEQLYLADSFVRKEFAFVENTYSEIKIGDYELSDIKRESEVVYLRDDNTGISTAVNGAYNDYSSLIASSLKGYSNSKSRKGTLEIPTSFAKTFKEEGALQKHIQVLMKDFMDSEKDAVFPESNGLKYEEIDKSKGSKSNDSGRETKNFIDDVFDFIAISFGIPPSLLKGDTVDTKDAVNNFLTFCINPLAKLITDELNRKMYGKTEYLKNTYTKLDTSNIKVVDLRDIANSLELLTRTGSNTIDDNLRALGREPIGGDIGGMRFITKNLESVDEVLKGGE